MFVPMYVKPPYKLGYQDIFHLSTYFRIHTRENVIGKTQNAWKQSKQLSPMREMCVWWSLL